ncbi:MAG: FtsL-like putative cell division protein [Lentimicrobiaceae bacterium]|jgi:hypothetical protein|nr:FtsL-like putative cell division protein [Lentimicrobiaceae bacterium]
MIANTLKQDIPQETVSEKKVPKPKKEKSFGKTAHSIIDGTIITREEISRHLPFLFFLTLLAIIYIANSYRAQKVAYSIGKLKNELHQLRYEYIETQSNLKNMSRQSEVVKEIANTGLKEAKTPAIVLTPDKKTNRE